MRNLLAILAVVGFISVAAFGAPIGYDAVTQTLTYGFGQDPAVAFQPASNIDPVGLKEVEVEYGNVSLANFRLKAAAKVIDFNTALGAYGSGLDVLVANVVGQLDANTSVKFTNFYNSVGGTASLGGAGIGGRGREGAYSGAVPATYECLGFYTWSASSWNGGSPTLSYIDFDIVPSDPAQGVTAIGMGIDGAGAGAGRDIGPGNFRFQLSDQSYSALIPYASTNFLPDGITPASNNLWLGYEAPEGLTIIHVHMEKIGSNGQPPVNIDDLSFTVAPEPATLGLLLVGGIATLIRRRR